MVVVPDRQATKAGGIDSLDNPVCHTVPPGYISWWNIGLLIRLQIRALEAKEDDREENET